MTSDARLNSGLYGVHRIFYILFGALALYMLVTAVQTLISIGHVAIGYLGMILLPVIGVAVAHWYAARGARAGKTYGKVLSRIIGTIWLIGFPIGTALGIYVWVQTGSARWKDSREAGPESA